MRLFVASKFKKCWFVLGRELSSNKQSKFSRRELPKRNEERKHSSFFFSNSPPRLPFGGGGGGEEKRPIYFGDNFDSLLLLRGLMRANPPSPIPLLAYTSTERKEDGTIGARLGSFHLR